MSYYWFLALPVLLVVGGVTAWKITQPKFILGLTYEFFWDLIMVSLPLFHNTHKSPQEWAEWRDLTSRKPGDLSASERTRLKVLKSQIYKRL